MPRGNSPSAVPLYTRLELSRMVALSTSFASPSSPNILYSPYTWAYAVPDLSGLAMTIFPFQRGSRSSAQLFGASSSGMRLVFTMNTIRCVLEAVHRASLSTMPASRFRASGDLYGAKSALALSSTERSPLQNTSQSGFSRSAAMRFMASPVPMRTEVRVWPVFSLNPCAMTSRSSGWLEEYSTTSPAHAEDAPVKPSAARPRVSPLAKNVIFFQTLRMASSVHQFSIRVFCC